MNYKGFCGNTEALQAFSADGERCNGWYQEIVRAPFAPTSTILLPTPGQEAYVQTPNVGARAFIDDALVGARAFCVMGGQLYELFANMTATARGAIAQDQYPATISFNGAAGGQLFITSGGNGYCFVLATNVLTLVLNNEATMGGMKDGFFLAFNILNGKVRLSALNDGTTWPALQYFQRSIAPDPWQAMIVANPLIWMLGSETSEPWYNSGASPQPFAPVLSGFIPMGTVAPFSAGIAGGLLTWLARTRDGSGKIVAAKGYTPQPLSNSAIETFISTYERTAKITDAEVMPYLQEGHLFACFSFPSANATLVVDMESGAWHERGTWNAPQNRYDAWHPRVYGHCFGKHLVGERQSGLISHLDVTIGTESDGSVIRRLRVGPPLWASTRQALAVSRFEIEMDNGLGIAAGQGSDPLMMARFSSDGKAYGVQRNATVGPMGQYGRRTFWTRCNGPQARMQKMWQPEITVTDPIPWRLSAATVDGIGLNQQERAA